MKFLITLILSFALANAQSQQTVRRFKGSSNPSNVKGSGYGDVYINTTNSKLFFCTNPSTNCNGVSDGQWKEANASPTTTQGDLIRRGASADERLAVGSEGAILGVISGVPAYSNVSNIKMDSSYLYSVSPPLADTTTKLATMFAVDREINAKTVPFTPGTDNNKTFLVSDSGTGGYVLRSFLAPFVFDNGSTVLTPSCSIREAIGGGKIKSVQLTSINSADGSDISGSVTVQFHTSPSTGSTTWTSIGSISLSSASRVADTTLSGWTTTVASDRLVRACVTGSPTSVQKLIVNVRFY